ncbi:hypothetical protein AOC05_12200 [Arthrobacter alpinus]|uniref:DUF4234 domain-containing protein n=1 Tax=Arthrobacter alpinus TaxID=656366 RepID=A0A0M4QGQ3_9MICC|nr:hypothetical protein AOC05_12200 [Arthrobacter alpinus]
MLRDQDHKGSLFAIEEIYLKKRSPLAVLLLPLITFGIYQIVWYVKTKNEMNQLGAQIPTAWLVIVPIVNIWWLWENSSGVERVTKNGLSKVSSFLLVLLLGSIGGAIVQNTFNTTVAVKAELQGVS